MSAIEVPVGGRAEDVVVADAGGLFAGADVEAILQAIGDPFATYVPVLTGASGNPTLGSGSIATGLYAKIGTLVAFLATIQFGTSGENAGSGRYHVSLPADFHASWDTNLQFGGGQLRDASGNTSRSLVLFRETDSTVTILPDAQTAFISSSSPWAWAAQDSIAIWGIYKGVA